MGAFADRCPQCGAYLKKGARSCRRCGWEPEVFVAPAPDGLEIAQAFRRGLAVGVGVGAGAGLGLGLAALFALLALLGR